jgi:hypothetical protein
MDSLLRQSGSNLAQISGKGKPVLIVRVTPVPRDVDGFSASPSGNPKRKLKKLRAKTEI